MDERFFVGIDLGGTNIKGGVTDAQGEVKFFKSIETEGEKGRDHVLDRIAMLADMVREGAGLAKDQVAGVGIGSPGPLDTKRGIIYEAPNLPGWENLALADEVARRCGYRVFIENDANAAALAEAVAGAGKGTDCMLMLTLGTGIGGGIVIGGRVWHGADDIAAELGHVSIHYDGVLCNCGVKGCVEAYASLSGASEITCAAVFEAAAAGDALARRIVDETIVYLATAIGSLINIFNPDMVVLFGGMTNAGDQLFVPLRQEVARRCFPVGARRCKIVRSELGDHAGVVGAAMTVKQRLEEENSR